MSGQPAQSTVPVSALIDSLTSRSLTAATVAELARKAARAAPNLDILLAQRIAAEAVNPSGRYNDADLARLLEVLDQFSGGRRAAPALGALLNHDNPRLRSKAALLMGRARQSAALAAKQLESPDPRVRANAVEALWRADGGTCRHILRRALRDPNGRVAGNAALGLCLLGDTAGVRELLAMSRHASAEVRSSAAWCMGAAEDPRFVATLEELASAGAGKARHNALRAISRIRQNAARITGAGRLRIEIADASVAAGKLRLQVAVASENQPDVPGIPGTGFVAWENGEMVEDYGVEEAAPPETLACGFVLPQGLAANAMKNSLSLRRCADLWAVAVYAMWPGGQRESTAAAAEARFLSDTGMLRAAVLSPGRPTKGMLATAMELANASALERGTRHIVLVAAPGTLSCGQANDLAIPARAAKAAVHVAALPGAGGAALESLAAGTGGRYLVLDSKEAAAEAVERLCLGMFRRYEVCWAPRSQPSEVRIEVWCGRGHGEVISTVACR